MASEFEIVPHTRLKYVTTFLVRLQARVTHIHRELEIGYVLDGEVSLRTEKQTVRLARGDLYLVNRMEPHEFISLGEGALLLAIQLSPKLMDGFLTPGTHYHYEGNANLHQQMISMPDQYDSLCSDCISLANSFLRRESGYEFSCFRLCGNIMYMLHTVLPWEEMSYEVYSAVKLRANRIIAITDYIDQNFQRKLLLSEIAERENLSMVYLSHFFKDMLGMPFQEYLNRKRFSYACQLLFTTDRTILDISLSSGFSDVRYFNQAFLNQYGCTPKEYRKGNSVQATQFRKIQQDNQQFFPDEDALRILAGLRK